MKVIFCLPGGTFTSGFLKSWTQLVVWLNKFNRINAEILQNYSPNVFECRNLIIGDGRACREPDVQPFGGRPYDYSFWIDSDIVFEPKDVVRVLFTAIKYKAPIISGVYATGPDELADMAVAGLGKGRASIKKLRKCKKEIVPADYAGWGFMCVRRGVFEALGFPWIDEPYREIDGMMINLGDDFSFCLRAKEKGFESFICPQAIVGHEKRSIILNRDET